MEYFMIDPFGVSFNTMMIMVTAFGLVLKFIGLQIISFQQRPLPSPLSDK